MGELKFQRGLNYAILASALSIPFTGLIGLVASGTFIAAKFGRLSREENYKEFKEEKKKLKEEAEKKKEHEIIAKKEAKTLKDYLSGSDKYKKENSGYKTRLNKIYDKFLTYWNKVYENFYGKKEEIKQVLPDSAPESFFSEDIRKNFDIYYNNRGGISLKRKNLEGKVAA